MTYSSEHPVFAKLPEASRLLGISVYTLRKGCKDGTVIHIKPGRDYLINVEAMRNRTGRESEGRGAQC